MHYTGVLMKRSFLPRQAQNKHEEMLNTGVFLQARNLRIDALFYQPNEVKLFPSPTFAENER